jgi:protocatechuate 3,4-dioxygenase beta subunit
VVDTSGCKPVTDAYVELWGCNSTGVYTGVQAKGNGDGSATAIKTNALRGVQPTGSNGTATFITVIPGHYVGRANHLHSKPPPSPSTIHCPLTNTHTAIIHHGAKLLPNNTIAGGTVSHVGQFYIEQNFLAQVEKTAPYNTNKQAQTLNSADALFNMGKQGGDDPVMKISLIGKTIADGLYATIDIGVNPRARQNPQPVNMWTSEGGKPVPGSPWTGYPDTCLYCGFRPPMSKKGVQGEVEAKVEMDVDME